ncbi:probable leucine-rich repeat receptor-like serine/threonine-protein kinase At3g14840 [Actinidia eriantha]|uniref:probable leucine-rich repeat receptor-like serine/threonine-protein kinase At3g14840 n=1 Tax=Actinidia eriantha TaxID=165200 RepID=UPI0025838FA8|nr:probable leucine-rich repeat receptor-like serine/threonine-protein kinase At3g14840 [Actinidia eriantha]
MSEYPKALWISMLILFMLICFEASEIEAQSGRIPDAEMKALQQIAEQLGKTDWNLSLNYCDENQNWQTPIKNGDYNSTVNCTCSLGECHINAIYLKRQDLSGVLPQSLVNLPFIRFIDFSRNYLSGSIPPQWASTKLEYMALSMNRLSGQIPKELGRMTSLTNMNLNFQELRKQHV